MDGVASLMSTKIKVPLKATALLVVLALVFAPGIWTAAWHLRHGHTLNWMGRSFFVPWGWYGQAEGRNATILKLSVTVLTEKTAPAAVNFSPVPVPPKNDDERESAYQSFPSVYWNFLATDRDQMTGPIGRGSGERRAVCMKTIHKEVERGVTVYCLAYGGTWYVSFVGDPKDLNTFYNILDDIR